MTVIPVQSSLPRPNSKQTAAEAPTASFARPVCLCCFRISTFASNGSQRSPTRVHYTLHRSRTTHQLNDVRPIGSGGPQALSSSQRESLVRRPTSSPLSLSRVRWAKKICFFRVPAQTSASSRSFLVTHPGGGGGRAARHAGA